MIKKALKIIGSLLLILVIAAFAIPYFYKDKIVEYVKTDINKNLNAVVDFEDVHLSLFKSFPDFNFTIENLSITGIEKFDGYKLIEADAIELSLDLMSVIRSEGPVEIHTFSFVKPDVHVLALRDGSTNYDIIKTNDTVQENKTTEEQNFTIQLRNYEVKNGNVVYDDKLNDSYIEIIDLNHQGNGEFTQDLFELVTSTEIMSLTAKSEGIAYLKKATSSIDLNILMDIPNSTYTIKENSVVVNALKLVTEGYVQMSENEANIDLKFGAPKNNFKNFVSLIPSAYTTNFEEVDANGQLQFNGFVKGRYDFETSTLPPFQLNLNISDGNIKYPELPLGINEINTSTSINSPSSDLDQMTIDIANFGMQIGENPFNAKARMSSLITNPTIDSKVKGAIDLNDLSKAFPMDGISELSGRISSNLVVNTALETIEAKDYENIDMEGELGVENLIYKSTNGSNVEISTMQMNFTPRLVELEQFEAKMGNSDFKANGSIDNILAYFSPEKTMTGNVKIQSSLIDANEWLTEEDTTQISPISKDSSVTAELFDRFDFSVDASANRIKYTTYELTDSKLSGRVTPNKASVEVFKTKIGESDFSATGEVWNIFNYLFKEETLTGKIDLTSDYINVNEFLTEENVSEEEIGILPVPENTVLTIDAQAKEVLYTNISLKDIKGKINVADQIAEISNATANTLGGEVGLNGSYNTQDLSKPKFEMAYNASSISYSDAFDKVNTFSTLAPIAKYIDGDLNSTFNISGLLGKDLLPVLGSLSATGFLETINGTVKNFKPLQEVANKINVDALKTVDLKNTRNWFEIDEGKVTLKDFNYQNSGINMVIGGTHSVTNKMNYRINAKIPRSLLQNNAIGQAADKGLNLLEDQASKLGLNIEEAQDLNVDAIITGSISNPKIKINLLGIDGKESAVQAITDNLKNQAIDEVSDAIEDKTGIDVQNLEEEVKVVKEDLSAKADEEIKALMDKTLANINNIMAEAEEKANQTRLEAEKLSAKTKTEGYKQADELIKKAGSNIFKKKAAEVAADKLRKSTDEKANAITQKGEETAQGILNTAKKQTDKLQAEADKQAEEIRNKYN